jgi:hypothetical protein
MSLFPFDSDGWRRDGCVLAPQLISPVRAERLRTLCDRVLEQWRACDPQTGEPGERPDATVMRHLNHPAYFAARAAEHAAERAEILAAAADPAVLGLVAAVFGEAPMFRCTSLFFNPSGISLDGNWHRDSQFSRRDDAAEWEMLRAAGENGSGMQLQIALAPSDDIEIVPGSHLRWDTPEEYAIRKADGGANNRSNAMPGARRVRQAPGDAVLFNPNAIHRGRYRSEIPRRTLMLTYTRRSEPWNDYFSAQPWFLEPGYLDGLDAAAQQFYGEFIAQYREFWTS